MAKLFRTVFNSWRPLRKVQHVGPSSIYQSTRSSTTIVACTILRERYENQRAIIIFYMPAENNIPAIKSDKGCKYKKIIGHAGIDGLQFATDQLRSILIHMMVSWLDHATQVKCQESFGSIWKVPTWEQFIGYLDKCFRLTEVILNPRPKQWHEYVTIKKGRNRCKLCKGAYPIVDFKILPASVTRGSRGRFPKGKLDFNYVKTGNGPTFCLSKYGVENVVRKTT